MMELFSKARRILSTDEFDKRRILAARKLYHDAKGKEKQMIGQLFESQMVLAKSPEESQWLQEVDLNYFSKTKRG